MDPTAQIEGLRQQVIQSLIANVQLRRRVYKLEVSARVAAEGRTTRLPLEFTSQFGECMTLWDLFDGQWEGYYIECGAYDGYRTSVTYPFEALGWTGLLVEAIPGPAAQCKERRPNSRVVHAALSRRGAPAEATFNVARGVELMSYLNPTPGQTYLVQQQGGRMEQVRVPVTTLDALLEQDPKVAWGGRVDFAVIDVEGNELDVLDGFDLDRWRPRIVVLEENQRNPSSPLVQHMVARGYQPVAYSWVNHYFVRRDDPQMLERATRAPLY
jgi:FkbM family methyltransferase